MKMKELIIYTFLIFITSNTIYCAHIEGGVHKITKMSKDLISGIFVGVNGESWVLPDTCLNENFENDLSGFIRHLKKFQYVYSSAYLNKIVIEDAFINCPADQIIYLYQDIDASIKSGQIYLNSIFQFKHIIDLIKDTIKARKLDANHIGIFFGKLISLTVYGKVPLNIENFFSFSEVEINKENREDEKLLSFSSELIKNILNFSNFTNIKKFESSEKEITTHNHINDTISQVFHKYKENKIQEFRWGFILDKQSEKFVRTKVSTILKKFVVLTLSLFELTRDLIVDFKLDSIDQEKIVLILDLISNMFKAY